MTSAPRAVLDSPRSEALPERSVRRCRPVRAASDEGRTPEEPVAAPHRASPASRPLRLVGSLGGLTVLVVEDDAASAEYFAVALRMAGAIAMIASTAVDALRMVQKHRPHVVLSDIAMPEHDGYWLVGAIRALADPALRDVPIVATTAHGASHSRERSLAAGFVNHLPKPVEPDRLWATIARAAGRSA